MSQRKGRRASYHLQSQVDAEINKLLKEGYIEKVEKIRDDVFVQL